MAYSQERIHYLLRVWTDKTADGAEENELMEWMREAEENTELKEFMHECWQQFKPGDDFSYVDWDRMFDRIRDKMQYGMVYTSEKKSKLFRLITKLAVAAAVLFFIVSGYQLMGNRNKSDDKNVQRTSNNRFKNDIAPAQEQVILTLADGSKVILDSMVNGSVTTQGNVQVIKQNGQLNYNSTANTNNIHGEKEVLYNTITISKGKQYALTLSDGTVVWLNAGSSLRFPALFTGKERIVELTGEGYFEVAPLSAKGGNGKVPFIVHINSLLGEGGMEVHVLGTHFNINAYKDEPAIKTTLLEGSVKIIQNNRLQMLSPGQQAQFTKDGSTRLIKEANTDQAIAWKYGLFDFDNDVLPDIMRQLSQWYDIEVTFVGPVPTGHYSGGIRRQVNLSEVLYMLETPGGVEFSIDGKRIFVKAK